jgi:hypothetical protein
VAQFVRPEHEPEPFAENLHLRRRDHVPARPLGDHHVRVVDDAAGTGPAEKAEGVREKDLL